MLDDKVRQEIRTRLESAFQERLKGVLLFGSKARGDALAESDIDLMVLLDEPVRLGIDLQRIVDALYPLQLELDAPIHALPVPIGSFEAGEYGVYRNARREGMML